MPTKPNKSYAKIDAPNGVWLEFAKVVVRYDTGSDSVEGLANARLIAAAPELLEALYLLTQSIYRSELKFASQEIAYDRALAAIKKATE